MAEQNAVKPATGTAGSASTGDEKPKATPAARKSTTTTTRRATSATAKPAAKPATSRAGSEKEQRLGPVLRHGPRVWPD